MTRSFEDDLELSLDLLIRESGIQAESLNSFRLTVTTTLTVGITIDAILASGAFQQQQVFKCLVPLIAASGSALLYLGFGLHLLWIRKKSSAWPDGAELASIGSTTDAKRDLVANLRKMLNEAQESLRSLQLRLLGMIGLLTLSVSAWVWLLRCAGQA